MQGQLKSNQEKFYTMPDIFLMPMKWVGMFPREHLLMSEVMKAAMPAVFNEVPAYARSIRHGVWKSNLTLLTRAYRTHNADVLKNCPKDKLLVLDSINCGWKVICDFVGRPVPDVDFP